MSEEEVYQICKVLFKDHYDEFRQAHASLKSMELSGYADTIIPLHPGAARFYREMDVLSN